MADINSPLTSTVRPLPFDSHLARRTTWGADFREGRGLLPWPSAPPAKQHHNQPSEGQQGPNGRGSQRAADSLRKNRWRIDCLSQSDGHHLRGGGSSPYQSTEYENPSGSFKSLHLHIMTIHSRLKLGDYNFRQDLEFGFHFLAPLYFSPNVKSNRPPKR